MYEMCTKCLKKYTKRNPILTHSILFLIKIAILIFFFILLAFHYTGIYKYTDIYTCMQ